MTAWRWWLGGAMLERGRGALNDMGKSRVHGKCITLEWKAISFTWRPMRIHPLFVVAISVFCLAGCEEGEGGSADESTAAEAKEEAPAAAAGEEKPGRVLGKKIVADYMAFLRKAKTTVQSNRSLDEMYTQIVTLRAHYTQVMLGHAKARVELGKAHMRDIDKLVRRQREVLPINLTNWIQPMSSKYASMHPALAESLVDLAVFINFYDLDELEKSDPERVAKLREMLAKL